ncbi:unnamed protein product [Chrysodeixis includens]|uniref:Uncharacterized protein n=1 Tax=Chrysodeixis includens TaxID=689277 RepID=A0A9N8L476_CHRIL|nr:unnamed protein product [Chrysodeixis includens]
MALAHIVQEEQQPAAAVYRPDQFAELDRQAGPIWHGLSAYSAGGTAASSRVCRPDQFAELDRQLDCTGRCREKQAEETVFYHLAHGLAHIVQEEQQPAAAVYRPDQFAG